MRYFLIVLRVLLAAVFIFAAYTKLRDPWMLFAMSIDAYGILPQGAVLFLGRTLPWFELALGLVLLSGWGLRYAATLATVLLGVFLGIMIHAYLQGLKIECGCFGSGEPIGPKTLLRDGSLVAASLLLTILAFRKGGKCEPAQFRDLAPVNS